MIRQKIYEPDLILVMSHGTLRIRHEAAYWNAYYMHNSVYDEVLFIGTILYRTVKEDQETRKLFVDLMKTIILKMIKDMTHERKAKR